MKVVQKSPGEGNEVMKLESRKGADWLGETLGTEQG